MRNIDPHKILGRIEKRPDGCWIWTGSKRKDGYGHFSVGHQRTNDRKVIRAHRWVFEYFKGPIPEGLVLDHLCRNPICVNPDHLEPVTDAVNVRRGNSGQHYGSRTHCKYGHPYTEDNFYIRTNPSGQFIGRQCKICFKRMYAAYKERQKLKQLE